MSVSVTADALARGCALALAQSRFVARALACEAAPLATLGALADAPWDAARLAVGLQAELARSGADAAGLAVALRRLRRRLMLGLVARDAAGVAPLAEVVGAVTALAELAVQRLLAAHAAELAAVHAVPCSDSGVPQDLLVVAMGKGGGGELNVSSDLDLIFVYDEDGETHPLPPYVDAARPITNHEFFERLGRRLIGALSEPTAEGFVFRIDMRLRPNGDAGPLAVSTAMLEEYFLRQGREWERFAWLKGRVISAPVFAGAPQFAAQCRALDDCVRPFVYRKYLDFNAIAALRELHAQIRAETTRKSARRAGGSDAHEDNVKLGRGGIREIEFIVQALQVVRGGRDARLRERSTLGALERLAQAGAMSAAIAEQLAAAYDFLRRLEHALQYVDDAQTHLFPPQPEERERIARLLRLPSVATLEQQLRATREFVAGAFDAAFIEPVHGEGDAVPAAELPAGVNGELATRLAALGYADADATAARVRGALASRRVQVASESVRGAIERLLLRAAAVLAREQWAAPPDEALGRFAQLIEVIAGRSTYVALLTQYPQAFARVLRLLAASRWAADYLARHPLLLDELLDERLVELTNASPVDWSHWRAEVRSHLAAHADDPERQMNLLRDEHHAEVFRLLVADLDGRLTVERLADHLSALADATLAVVLEQVWATLPRRHAAECRFAILGYGKLGGKELGYASDLDLVFVYDDPHADAAETYTTLVRRLMLWLSTQTSSGHLFDVDLRLRPNGDSGLMVVPWDAFERYQRNDDGHGAWTWEHQALTRARFCAGDAALGARFEQLRCEVLARPRDLEKLRADVLQMRRKMTAGHPNRSALFDLKHDRGGMVDIEFIVQFLVLAHAHAQPSLLGNLGNIALLRIAGELGLIDATLAGEVADAYRSFRALQHKLRLNGAEYARVAPEQVAREAAAVRALWAAVIGDR
ncbi:MAG: bifunctional [glutamate--ammonia ligase]-adenylyl-L-tyrosine phosphorylase/[glutamate--ammonia-ligase] adenylyltransferase [Betaproteobacteria bacterium]